MSIDPFLKLPVKRYLAMNTYIRKGGKIVQPRTSHKSKRDNSSQIIKIKTLKVLGKK
jgi:hypothetical protein